MKTREDSIVEGFAALRLVCDPRGHGLLDALEKLCATESAILDVVVTAIDEMPLVTPGNVIPLIRDYSVKA